MAVQVMNIRLPDRLYKRVKQRADQTKRSVEDELVAVVEDALVDDDWSGIPQDIALELKQLKFLDDSYLWEVARQVVPSAKSARMQTLVLKQQNEGLTKHEEAEAKLLQHVAHRVMLLRAEAALLLKTRGHNISTLKMPLPEL